MKRAAWIVVALLSACGSEGASPEQLADQVRGDLGWWTKEADASSGASLPIVHVSPSAWVRLDPLHQTIDPDVNAVDLDGWSAARGGAGVLVRYQGGAFSMGFRVRLDRINFATALQAGMSLIGSAARSGPRVGLQFSCGPAPGDIRFRISGQSSRLSGDGHDSHYITEFGIGEMVSVTIERKKVDGPILMRVARPLTESIEIEVVDPYLPKGVYLVGALPWLDNPGECRLRARVELLDLRGEVQVLDQPFEELAGRFPDFQALCTTGRVSPDDPYGEAIEILGDANVSLLRAERRLSSLQSSFDLEPDLDYWTGWAALKAGKPRANVFLRAGVKSTLAALTGDFPTLNDRGTLGEIWQLRNDREWEDNVRQLSLLLQVRVHIGLSHGGQIGGEADEDALKLVLEVTPCDDSAELVLILADRIPPKKVDFELVAKRIDHQEVDAAFLLQLAEVALGKFEREVARDAVIRALKRGHCSLANDGLIDRLWEGEEREDTLEELKELRTQAVPRLRAAMLHQRWMGLGEVAASTAETLLRLVGRRIGEDLDLARDVALCLAVGGQRTRVQELIEIYPKIESVVQAALEADPVLKVLKER